jgi:acetoacetyl-CoA synthetase
VILIVADELSSSVVVGQRRPRDADERVVLFLMMNPGQNFTPQLVKEVKQAIRTALSPRHVPAFIFETPDIPVRASY